MKRAFLLLITFILSVNTGYAYNDSLFSDDILNRDKIDLEFIEQKNHHQDVDIQIISLLPNPIGNDIERTEIKIANLNHDNVSLKGWQINTNKEKYVFENKSLKEGEVKAFTKINNKSIVLKNKGDSVRLIHPNGELIQKVSYVDSPEGSYYIQDKTTGLFSFRNKVIREKILNRRVQNQVKTDEINKNQKVIKPETLSILEIPSSNSLSETSNNSSKINIKPNHIPSIIILLLFATSFSFVIWKWKDIFIQ